jgi:hypothetical protein
MEFRKDDIEKMIRKKTDESSWQFVFLSADLDAIGDANALGISAASSLLFRKSGKGSADAWDSLSISASAYRAARSKAMVFRDEDRKHPDDPHRKKKKK